MGTSRARLRSGSALGTRSRGPATCMYSSPAPAYGTRSRSRSRYPRSGTTTCRGPRLRSSQPRARSDAAPPSRSRRPPWRLRGRQSQTRGRGLGPSSGGQTTCDVPSRSPQKGPADGAASCLTYLIVWSAVCPTSSGGGLRRTAGVEAGEQVVRAGPPRRRVRAAALSLVQLREILVAARERIGIVESRDELDGPEQVLLRLRPVPALRENEAEVRLGGRHGDRIADRLRKTKRAFRARRRGLDRLEAQEILDRIREGDRGEPHVPRPQRDFRGPLERDNGLIGVAFPAQDDPEVDLNRGVVSGPVAGHRRGFGEAGLRPRIVALCDQRGAEVDQGANLFPGAVLEDRRRTLEMRDGGAHVPEAALDRPEGAQRLPLGGQVGQRFSFLDRLPQHRSRVRVRAQSVRDAAESDVGPEPFRGRAGRDYP